MSSHRQHLTPAPETRPDTEQAAGVVLAIVIALCLVLAAVHGLGSLLR